jgi:NAD(P)-dependent dehydrogenase (short-subunit alcohol dehydrogenase family)
MELKLKDKVAIVTGGGWGMGRATVLGLADEGVKVVISDLDEGRGNAAAKEVKDKGGEALFVKGDVANWEMVKQGVIDTLERFGQIDILVNNAGAWQNEFFVKQKRENWVFQVEVCFYGTLNFTKAVIEHMISRKAGSIINVASDAARVGEPNQPIYSGAKAAVVGFSKALAKEVGRQGIRVNVVCPSMTIGERRTEMVEKMKQESLEKYTAYEDQMKKVLGLYPLRKLGKPEDVANMIVFLASDLRAGHITGQTISVNGGYCMI